MKYNKQEILNNLDFHSFFGAHVEKMGPVRGDGETSCLCCFHEESNPSLSINVHTGLYDCKACGAKGDVFTFYRETHHCDFNTAIKELAAQAGVNGGNGKKTEICRYPYVDEQGERLFDAVRFSNPKTFRQGHYKNGKFVWNLKGVRRVLYRLPEILKADEVLIFEGEKDVDRAAKMGFVATCNPMGAGKWKAEYNECLRGKKVFIVSDLDEPGQDHAADVAGQLAGIAAEVRVVELPGLGPILPKHGKDFSDWVELLDGQEDAKEKLTALMEDAKPAVDFDGPETITAKDLSNLEIPPIKWAVDGVIAEGLTILAGKPKMGKSILAMNLCISVAIGTKALGYADCKTGGVLYLALEDVKRRLQSRLNTMMLPEQLNGEGMPENLHFATEWPRMGNGGIKQLREKIKSIPGIKMVVIDTLKMFRPTDSENKKVYDADYDPISALKKVADEFNIAVVIIHHLRKSASEDVMDTLSGSFGLTGASDTNIVVERSTAATSDAVLHVVGRDVEAAQLGMTFEPHTLSWNILGPMSQLVGGSIQQQEVFDAIKDGFSSPADVRRKTDLNRDNINKAIKKLLKLGKIEKVGHGEYEVINLEEPIVRTTEDEVPS